MSSRRAQPRHDQVAQNGYHQLSEHGTFEALGYRSRPPKRWYVSSMILQALANMAL